MQYKSLLVHVEPGEEADGRLEAACGLAARCDALLIGVAAAMFEMPIMDPTGYAPVDAEIISSERQSLEAELEDCEKKFRQAAAAKNLRTAWHSALEFPADMVCRIARGADLLIIGHGASAATVSPQHVIDPGDVLLQAGRPSLVVPPAMSELRLNQALIAWKDTREARRALADSISLLKLAGKTHVVSICPESEAETAATEIADVAAYLERHGIHATQEVKQVSHEHAADGVLHAAEGLHADLIVAGAYGHARMREWVFGGVTADLLKKSSIACLLSH